MKTIKSLFFLLYVLGIMSPTFAFAAPDIGISNRNGLTQQVAGKIGYDLSTNKYTLSEMIGGGIKIALAFVGTIFFALTVYAGFLWMTAQGNEETVAKATGILRTAIIGMIIVAAAYSITAFAMIFSAKSTSFSQMTGQ